jgi:hypothetical protein
LVSDLAAVVVEAVAVIVMVSPVVPGENSNGMLR